MFQQPVSPSRRRYSRFDTPESVSVYWSCSGRDDTSRVRNLSLGGLFIETREPGLLGAKTKLDFLVQEGQIRAEAVVRHASPGRGLGLKFTAVTDKDRPHLAALFNRLLNAKNYKNNTFAAVRYTAGTRDLMQRGVSSNWRKTSA
jgi:hypothetical protein